MMAYNLSLKRINLVNFEVAIIRPTRSATLAVFFITGFLLLNVVESFFMIDKTKALEDRALHGHAFRNLTMKTTDECFLACYEDCFCMTFQMFKNTECQLLSSNQFQSPSALLFMIGYTYYDMVPDTEQVRLKNVASSCSSGWNCQIHFNLCHHGGSYEPLLPTDYTLPRYKCNCSAGYTGHLCENVVKSCRGYINGRRVPGKYKVFDDYMNLFEVFCDFDLNSTMAWTLIQSYQLQYEASTFRKSFNLDHPQYEDTPRWDVYRLSKSRMLSIQKDSSKWRMTCKYDTDGVVYRDYLEAINDQLDVITFENENSCSLVEWIDIRGQSCKQCTAFIVQSVVHMVSLHSDSFHPANVGCQFRPTESKSCNTVGEDNFGFYHCINSVHRCSSSTSATTQTWFGAN